jgi:hypothetical protein
MANVVICIVKDNYVINRVLVPEEDASTYVYPFPHDLQVIDEQMLVYIGDWYEQPEDIFYRPIEKIPPDVPTEIQPDPQPEP